MLRGEIATMPLAEVLQWAEWNGRGGLLLLEREGPKMWLRLLGRTVLATAPAPAGGEVLAKLRPETADEPWLTLPPELEAEERLIDLFLEDEGAFVFLPKAPDPEPGVALDLAIRKLVHEGMRHRDEWPAIDAADPDETAALKLGDQVEPTGHGDLARLLVRCASKSLTLGEVRVTFALSRPALLRRVHELVRLGCLKVEGADAGADPVGQLTAKAMQLATAGQFDEARHVLETVLATDPNDARLRALLDDVAGRQLDALRSEFDGEAPLRRLNSHPADEAAGLTATERELYERIEEGMAVGTLVIASPLRELETLRTLEKMVHLDLVGMG